MKNKIILNMFLALFLGINLTNYVNSEPNYKYKIYTPKNITDVSKNVAKIKRDEQIIFIVDFSNSMNDSIDGVPKINIARNTIAELLPKIPPDVQVGLRVYGHRSGFTYLQGCQASDLAVPLGYSNYQSILSSLYSTRAVGWTPITYSLKQAVNYDLVGQYGKKHIILLTDGGENCDESPCTYVINLMKTRDDITIDVIAFDVHDTEANNQLKCTALMTSGKFLNANTQKDLYYSLFETFGIDKNVRGSIKVNP